MSKNTKIVAVVAALVALLLTLSRIWQDGELETVGSPSPRSAPATEREGPRLVTAGRRPEVAAPVLEESPPESIGPPLASVTSNEEVASPPPTDARLRLRRKYELEVVLKFEEIRLGGMGSALEKTSEDSNLSLAFDFHLHAIDDPAEEIPTAAREVRRRYERVLGLWRVGGESLPRWSLGLDPQEHAEQGRSPLNGADVVFRWEPNSSEYHASFADGVERGDLERLGNLSEDLDLRGLAPPPGTTPGSHWTLPIEALDALMRPGGDLQIEYGDAAGRGIFRHALWPTTARREAATVRGTIEADATRWLPSSARPLLVVELQAEATATWSQLGELPSTSEISVMLEGELIWDVEAGRAHSLVAELELELQVHLGEPSSEKHLEVHLAGSGDLRLETELVE